MIRCWDYFMRRKARLLSIMVLFLLSSLLSYHFLRQQQIELPTHEAPTTYINISISDPEVPDEAIEVPHTGGLITDSSAIPSTSSVLSTVISPQEVTNLEIHNTDTEQDINQAIVEPIIDILAPDVLPQYTQPELAPTTTSADSRTPFVITLLIGCSITGGFWLYFLYEHYTR